MKEKSQVVPKPEGVLHKLLFRTTHNSKRHAECKFSYLGLKLNPIHLSLGREMEEFSRNGENSMSD